MKVLTYPGDLVPSRCGAVDHFNGDLRRFVAEMLGLMRTSRGEGLSAPQIGSDRRIFVVDSREQGPGLIVMINPRIIWASREDCSEHEGCLSIPSVLIPLRRPSWIEVEYQTVAGETITSVFGGWSSRLIQHEMDHLDGMVMLDHLDAFDRSLIIDCCRSNKHT